MLWLALLGEEVVLLHHVPDMKDNANIHPKELAEAAVLHGGHPDIWGHLVLDVLGGTKKHILNVVVGVVVLIILVAVVAQDNKVITHLLFRLLFIVVAVVVDGGGSGAGGGSGGGGIPHDGVVCCVMWLVLWLCCH